MSATAKRFARGPMVGMGVVAIMGMLLSACANPGVTALGTNVPLAPAPDLAGAATEGVMIWRTPDLGEHQSATKAYMIPPVTVYRGKGSFFSSLSPQQVDDVAAGLTTAVRAEVGRHFKVVNESGPGIVTLSLILAKIVPPRVEYASKGFKATADLPVGVDGPGMTAGTMTVSGKFSDSQTGKLLVGFVAPVSPEVFDLALPGNPARALDFADAATQQFATDLVNAIIRQRQINKVPVTK